MRLLLSFLLALITVSASAQTPQGSQLMRTMPKSLEYYYGKIVGGKTAPFAHVSEANSLIPVTRRHIGLTIPIGPDSTDWVEYWYYNGIGNDKLVVKTTGGSGGTDTTGLGLASRYWVGQQGFLTSASTLSASNLTTGTLPIARLADGSVTVTKINASGGATGKVLGWDGWVDMTGGGGGVTTFAALSDNTTVDIPTMNAPTAAALALKAPIASPTFTGTVSGVTAAMVGLGNVDNTADALKPVSAAQAAADAAVQAFAIQRANHTGVQAATTITQDATHRFATDAEKATWNAAAQQWVANVMDYGAVGDGSTDDRAAFNAAIATGLPVYIPAAPVKYRISAVLDTIQYGQSVFGDGDLSVVYYPTYAPSSIFNCAGSNVMRSFRITGDGPGGMPSGNNPLLYNIKAITLVGAGSKVSDMTIDNIYGIAILVAGPHCLISDNRTSNNTAGVCINAEYCNLVGGVHYDYYFGIHVTTGNNLVSGCLVGGGILYVNIVNGDHSSFIGVTANHCASGFMVNTGIGLNVIGCNFWDTDIIFGAGVVGLNFQGCQIGTGSVINIAGATISDCSFRDNYVSASVVLPVDPNIRLLNNFGAVAHTYPKSIDQMAAKVTGASSAEYLPIEVGGVTYYILVTTTAP